jgi:hypothetical protein
MTSVVVNANSGPDLAAVTNLRPGDQVMFQTDDGPLEGTVACVSGQGVVFYIALHTGSGEYVEVIHTP